MTQNNNANTQRRNANLVPSPCISVCRIDEASGWCSGCQRSLSEIAAWAAMSEADKRAVWAQLGARRAAARSGALGVEGTTTTAEPKL